MQVGGASTHSVARLNPGLAATRRQQCDNDKDVLHHHHHCYKLVGLLREEMRMKLLGYTGLQLERFAYSHTLMTTTKKVKIAGRRRIASATTIVRLART